MPIFQGPMTCYCKLEHDKDPNKRKMFEDFSEKDENGEVFTQEELCGQYRYE